MNERDLMLFGAAPTGEPGWAEFEADYLGRTRGCPPLEELIQTATGEAEPITLAKLQDHLPQCYGCRRFVEDYRAGAMGQEEAPPSRTLRDALAESRQDRLTEGDPREPTLSFRLALGLTDSCRTMNTIALLLLSGQTEQAARYLRPALPVFLEAVGLSSDLADRFLQFILRRITQERCLPPSGLPGWLRDFARDDLGRADVPFTPSPQEWVLILSEASLVLLEESDKVDAFCKAFVSEVRRKEPAARTLQGLQLVQAEMAQNRTATTVISPGEVRSLMRQGRIELDRYVDLFPGN